MSWQEREPGVFYSDVSPVWVTAAEMRMLEVTAKNHPRGRARLCGHPSPADTLHEMLICLAQHSYVRPHRHFKSESALVLRGSAELVLFSEEGEITDVKTLGADGTGQPFFVRLSEPVFHTYRVRSEFFSFLETTPGPLDRRTTEYAPWAPAETDPHADYCDALAARVRHFVRS